MSELRKKCLKKLYIVKNRQSNQNIKDWQHGKNLVTTFCRYIKEKYEIFGIE